MNFYECLIISASACNMLEGEGKKRYEKKIKAVSRFEPEPTASKSEAIRVGPLEHVICTTKDHCSPAIKGYFVIQFTW